MIRLMLNDEHWSKFKDIMLQNGIYDKPNLRIVVEGILYRMRVGCPWRDLPECFGNWNSVYKQFNRWSAAGKIMNFFKMMVQDPDLEWGFIDGSIVRSHQHSAGAPGNEDQGIGISCGGNSTKIHMVVESCGFPIEFDITGGEVHDSKKAPDLIEKMPVTEFTIADKGYDSEELRKQIMEKGSIPVIPRKSNSKIGNVTMDWCLYKYRHLVENLFARIKHFRAIATRYDKLKRNFAAMISMACAYLWLPL